MSFEAFGWILTDNIAIYMSEFILISSTDRQNELRWYASHHDQSLALSILLSSHHSGTNWPLSLLCIGCCSRIVRDFVKRCFWGTLLWSSCYYGLPVVLHLVVNPLYLLHWTFLLIVDFDPDTPTLCGLTFGHLTLALVCAFWTSSSSDGEVSTNFMPYTTPLGGCSWSSRLLSSVHQAKNSLIFPLLISLVFRAIWCSWVTL